MVLLSTALLTDLTTPGGSDESAILSQATVVGQTFIYRSSGGDTRIWRAKAIVSTTSGSYSINDGWEMLYGIRFSSGAPSSHPRAKGEWYIDTSNNVVYIGKDASSGSWIALTGSAISGS